MFVSRVIAEFATAQTISVRVSFVSNLILYHDSELDQKHSMASRTLFGTKCVQKNIYNKEHKGGEE